MVLREQYIRYGAVDYRLPAIRTDAVPGPDRDIGTDDVRVLDIHLCAGDVLHQAGTDLGQQFLFRPELDRRTQCRLLGVRYLVGECLVEAVRDEPSVVVVKRIAAAHVERTVQRPVDAGPGDRQRLDRGVIVAKFGRVIFDLLHAQRDLERAIEHGAAVRLGFPDLPIGEVVLCLGRLVPGKGLLHLQFVAGIRRQLQGTPDAGLQFLPRAFVPDLGRIGVNHGAIWHIDPDIALGFNQPDPHVAGCQPQEHVGLGMNVQPVSGVQTATDARRRRDQQRRLRAVANTALRRCQTDGTADDPVALRSVRGGNLDGTGRGQDHAAETRRADIIDRQIAGFLRDHDAASGACGEQSGSGRLGDIDLQGRGLVANPLLCLKDNTIAADRPVGRTGQYPASGGDRRRAGRIEDRAVDIEIAGNRLD